MQLISSLPSALKSNDDVNFKDCFSLLFHPVRWITISLSGTYWLQHLQVSLFPYFSIVHFCKDQLSLCLISVFDGDDFNLFFAKNLKPMSGFYWQNYPLAFVSSLDTWRMAKVSRRRVFMRKRALHLHGAPLWRPHRLSRILGRIGLS